MTRIGLLGCGRIGRMHAANIAAHPNAALAAVIVLRTASGRQCHINNSRTAGYGYDQRVELLGKEGMLISGNRKPHELRRYGAERTESSEPYQFFFVERYHEAFVAELDAFVRAVERGEAPEVGFDDGHRALRLAEAAYRSIAERRLVGVDEIGSETTPGAG